MFDTFTMETGPSQYAAADNINDRVRQSFSNDMTDSEKRTLAQDVARALLDDREAFGKWITNKQARRTANLPTPSNGGAIKCPGCAEQGHDATVNVSALQTRHLPYLKSAADMGDRTPTDLLRVGCELCNGDDGDAHKSHKRRCGITCCN